MVDRKGSGMSSLFPLHGFSIKTPGEKPAYSYLYSALVELTKTIPLPTVVIADKTYDLEFSEESVGQFLTLREAQFGGLHFPLGETSAFSMLSFAGESGFKSEKYHILSWKLAKAQPGVSNLNEVIDLFSRVSLAFGASLGGFYHPDQKTIMLNNQLAGDAGGIVINHDITNVAAEKLEGITEQQLKHLSAACHPQNLNRTRIPETLWWGSYWSEDVLTDIGKVLIDSVDWFMRKDLDHASMLIATAFPPRLGDDEGLSKLAEISAKLKLIEKQKCE